MSGIDRLRTLAGVWDACGLGGTLGDVARQIERKLTCDEDTIENVRLIVGGIIDDMERHVLGHEGMDDSPVARWARELREALGGDKHDPAKDVSMSAYDLLPEDKREAIALVREHGGLEDVRAQLDVWQDVFSWAVELGGVETCHEAARWVREHGGLDYVMHEWQSRVPRDRYERRRQRLLGHIAECEEALGRRNERIEGLGKTIEFFQLNNSNFRHLLADVAERLGFTRYGDDYEPEDLLDALDRRLMPDGMEWPRFEGGEPVRIGDQFAEHGGCENVADSVEIGDCWFKIHGFDGAAPRYSKGASVKRPAPKVLDADGVEVEVGDDLYSVEGMLKFHVSAIDRKSGRIATEAMFALDKWADPKMYTHRAPVLAADGRPLREGETVYLINSPTVFVVDDIMTREDGATVVHLKDGAWNRPQDLTHERPDSWERLEEDATKLSPYYYARDVMRLDTDKMPPKESRRIDMMRDIVRRAKKLAGVE